MRRGSRLHRPAVAALAACAAMAIAACGTTVRETTTTTIGGDGPTAAQGDGLDSGTAATTPASGATDAPAPASGTGATGSTDGAASGTTLGSGTRGSVNTTPSTRATIAGSRTGPGATAKPGSSTAASSAAAGPIPDKGQGWDSKYVYVGITTENDVSGAASAAGLALAPGNVEGDASAFVNAINSAGGIYGRQVKLVKYDVSTTSAQANADAVASEACATFTQDNTVIGVVNMTTAIDNSTFRTCMAQHHTTIFSGSVAPLVNSDFAKFSPWLYAALNLPYERIIPVLMTRLKAQGYFTGWSTLAGSPSTTAKVKVGVLYSTKDSSSTTAKDELVQALQAQGVATDTYGLSSTTDFAPAELRFASGGVTHVMELDSGLLGFMIAANAQHYFPRYGLTTLNALDPFLAGNAPKQELNGAVGIGWLPALDVEAPQDPGMVSPGETLCLSELQKGGQTFSSSRFAEAVGLAMCDAFTIMKTAAEAGGGLDQSSLHKGINTAGPKVQQATTFVNGITPSTPWIPGGARDVGFENGCACFKYHGSTYRF